MLKSVYDTDNNGIVDNSEKLEGFTKAQVQDHTPKVHGDAEHSVTYEKTSNKDVANGYCGLDASALIALTRIPRLDLTKIPLGSNGYFLKGQGVSDPIYALLTQGDIPDLDASKITTGILLGGRGGLEKALSPTWTNDFILVYKTATDNFVMEAKPAGGGGESENIVRLTTDRANSTTSFADCTGLSFSPAANTDYLIEFFILYTTSATTVGINLAVNGPASPTGMAFQTLGNTAAATLAGREFNAYNTSGGTLTAAIAGYNIAIIKGILRNGANTGTFILRFAAETTGTVTIKIGSVLRWRQIS